MMFKAMGLPMIPRPMKPTLADMEVLLDKAESGACAFTAACRAVREQMPLLLEACSLK